MTVKEISVPTFIWYVLPGLNAVFFVFVLPVAVLDFEVLAAGFSATTVLGWVIAGLVIGSLMDSVKLYQLTPGYAAIRREFMKDLGDAVIGQRTREGGDKVLTVMQLLDRKRQVLPSWEHSRWVMINHTAKAAALGTAVWILLAVRLWHQPITLLARYPLTTIEARAMLVFMVVACLSLSFRLHTVSLRVIRDANASYLEYAKRHKTELIDSGQIPRRDAPAAAPTKNTKDRKDAKKAS